MFDILLSDRTLSVESCKTFIQDDQAGGHVIFIGTVRNHTSEKTVTHLNFEAYKPMAEKEMKKIAVSALENFDVRKVAIHHRTGHLEIGEIPVIIGVSAAHRKAAFKACEFCIDTLKESVPIWKKEYFEDGEVWVAAHP